MGAAFSCCKNDIKRDITLLLIGLDNSGKTCTAKHLSKESTSDVVPTIGFSNITLQERRANISLYDLGGGSRIRGIWTNYYAFAHGTIFVVDSSDPTRLEECQSVLSNVVKDPRMAGKPILLLINKQDKPGALDEIEVCKLLDLENLVNQYKCPTRVETTNALLENPSKDKLDYGILQGYQWLLNLIQASYQTLNDRVQANSQAQKELEGKAMKEKVERIQKLREERERQNQEDDKENGAMEFHGNPFKPISAFCDKGIENASFTNPSSNINGTGDKNGGFPKSSTPKKHFKNKVAPQDTSSPNKPLCAESSPSNGGKVNWALSEESSPPSSPKR